MSLFKILYGMPCILQSLTDRDLKLMNRDHTAAEAQWYRHIYCMCAYRIHGMWKIRYSHHYYHKVILLFCSALQEVHEVFLGQVNIDLIFGRPFQALDEWIKELSKV